jgi:hypothetical protein
VKRRRDPAEVESSGAPSFSGNDQHFFSLAPSRERVGVRGERFSDRVPTWCRPQSCRSESSARDAGDPDTAS